MAEPRADSLDVIAEEVRVCTKCDLCKTRTKAVPGEGSYQADILFIGEGPGMHEDRQGRPFVGAAGQFLDELLASVGMKRPDCFITNVVKCRPPNNRDPEPQEIAACADYLTRQIAALNPKLIVTLGRYSMAKFFPGESIGRIHGKLRKVNGRFVLPMYHPAAAFRQLELRNVIFTDFKQVPAALEMARKQPPEPAQQKPEEPPPQQLSLFDM
ncbi:MAG TPA: uracil-DNA glycosylase [Ktedonobacterales bacterium]|nr:uracil-DNA glycosylase [Ktedonobacterales bacterium]